MGKPKQKTKIAAETPPNADGPAYQQKPMRKKLSSALKTSWADKMRMKADKAHVKKRQEEIRADIAAAKTQKIQERKDREERRKANERKGEVVQPIRNTAKLKRMKKKDLKRIEKRDFS